MKETILLMTMFILVVHLFVDLFVSIIIRIIAENIRNRKSEDKDAIIVMVHAV